MQSRTKRYDPRARARAKQASRAADERALASGEKTVAELKRENEVFAPLALRTSRPHRIAPAQLGDMDTKPPLRPE